MEATVLYSSAAIHAKIKSILGQPKNGERRVAIVAYVGEHAPAYLPQPKGLSLICCPAPGATSAAALRRIMHAGANVRFAERLHMKVYWSQARGCIITSANLSSSALGASGLKEAGVFLPPGSVDIDELIHRATAVKHLLEICSTCQCETIADCRLLDEPLKPPPEQPADTALKRRIARHPGTHADS